MNTIASMQPPNKRFETQSRPKENVSAGLPMPKANVQVGTLSVLHVRKEKEMDNTLTALLFDGTDV